MSELRNDNEIPQWDLADRMAKALRTSGVSPQQMADMLDCHRNTVSNYLHGRSRVPRAVLIAWADITQFPLEWLETGQVSAQPLPADNDRYTVAA